VEDLFDRSVERARSMDVDEAARVVGIIQEAFIKFQEMSE
jgi:phage antirepressor YoqD-like protein